MTLTRRTFLDQEDSCNRTGLRWAEPPAVGGGANSSLVSEGLTPEQFRPVLVSPPVLAVVQGDVGQLVTVDPLQEVRHRLLLVTAGVVRAAQLHLLWDVDRSVRARVLERGLSQLSAPTLIFSAMISGSSQMDSTKKTWWGQRSGTGFTQTQENQTWTRI